MTAFPAGIIMQIAIPYSAIVDVEKSSAMDFSETIEVKVVDKNEQYSVDSYFFAYFQDLPAALEQIRDAVRAYRAIPGCSSPPVLDSTTPSAPLSPTPTGTGADRMLSAPLQAHLEQPQPQRSSSAFRFTSLLRPLTDLPFSKAFQIIEPEPKAAPAAAEEYTHISKRSASSFVPVTTTPPSHSHSGSQSPELTPVATGTGSQGWTYPPSVSGSMMGAELTSSPTRESSTNGSAWSVPGIGMPSWLKMPSRKMLTSTFSSVASRPSMIAHSVSMPASTSSGGVSEVVSTNLSLSTSRSGGDYGFFSILEAPETMLEQDVVEKFRSSFAFDEKERLLGCECSSCSDGIVALTDGLYRFPGVHLQIAACLRKIVHLK